MEMRGHANTELVESKELRLKEALRREQNQYIFGMMPSGPREPINTITGTNTVTLAVPLEIVVPVAEHTVEVLDEENENGADPTGGYQPRIIRAGKQLASLEEAAVLDFAGRSPNTYIIYAVHNWQNESPVLRAPPGKFHGGPGASAEHTTFFNHGQSGLPVPRPDYDEGRTSQTVYAKVDRVTISLGLDISVPSNAVKLLSATWNGTNVVDVRTIATPVNVEAQLQKLRIDLQGKIDTQSTQLNSLVNSVNSLIADLASVKQKQSAHSQDIVTLQDNYSSHQGSIGALQSSLAQTNRNVSTINNNFNNHNHNIAYPRFGEFHRQIKQVSTFHVLLKDALTLTNLSQTVAFFWMNVPTGKSAIIRSISFGVSGAGGQFNGTQLKLRIRVNGSIVWAHGDSIFRDTSASITLKSGGGDSYVAAQVYIDNPAKYEQLRDVYFDASIEIR